VKKRNNVIRPSLRATSKFATPSQVLPPSEPRSQPYRRLWSAIRWTIGTTVAILGLLAVVDQFWGHPWPSDPDIQPQNTLRDSSFILPFALKNKSIFPMHNVAMTCGVDLYVFKDANGMIGAFRDGQFGNKTISIGRNTPVNYTCNATDFIRLRDDYSLVIGFPDGQFLETKRSDFRPPLTVIKMCLYIKGVYRLAGIGLSFTSAMFQWPAAPGLAQWIEGPITSDLPSETWVPVDSRIGAVWALRAMMSPDKKHFLPGALQCTQVQ